MHQDLSKSSNIPLTATACHRTNICEWADRKVDETEVFRTAGNGKKAEKQKTKRTPKFKNDM